MAVPEAAMNEHDGSMLSENEIGFSRQVFSVKSEAKPESMRSSPHTHFRACMLTSDPRHEPRAPFGGNVIDHLSSLSQASPFDSLRNNEQNLFGDYGRDAVPNHSEAVPNRVVKSVGVRKTL